MGCPLDSKRCVCCIIIIIVAFILLLMRDLAALGWRRCRAGVRGRGNAYSLRDSCGLPPRSIDHIVCMPSTTSWVWRLSACVRVASRLHHGSTHLLSCW